MKAYTHHEIENGIATLLAAQYGDIEPPTDWEPEDPEMVKPYGADTCPVCLGYGSVNVMIDPDLGRVIGDTCDRCGGSGDVAGGVA